MDKEVNTVGRTLFNALGCRRCKEYIKSNKKVEMVGEDNSYEVYTVDCDHFDECIDGLREWQQRT